MGGTVRLVHGYEIATVGLAPTRRNRFGVLIAKPSPIAIVGLRPTIAVLYGGSRMLARQTCCEGGLKAHLRDTLILEGHDIGITDRPHGAPYVCRNRFV